MRKKCKIEAFSIKILMYNYLMFTKAAFIGLKNSNIVKYLYNLKQLLLCEYIVLFVLIMLQSFVAI